MLIINHLIKIIIVKQIFPDVCSMEISILDSYSVKTFYSRVPKF